MWLKTRHHKTRIHAYQQPMFFFINLILFSLRSIAQRDFVRKSPESSFSLPLQGGRSLFGKIEQGIVDIDKVIGVKIEDHIREDK